MNVRIKNAVKIVNNHLPALFLGASAGAAVVFFYYNKKTLLELPAEAAKKLVEQGGVYIYEAHGDSFFLVHHIS